MKYIRFLKDENEYCGILKENTISVLKGDFFGELDFSGISYDINTVKILPPVKPSKIIAVGLNYNDHIKEMNHDVHSEPVIFLKPDTSVIGEGDKIIIPKMSKQVDYEAELAVVIKREAKNIEEKDAKDYILGYTCLNDVTARDLQKTDGQWVRAKGFDTFAPIGPYVDSKIDPDNTDIKLILNGEVKQHSNTRNFLFKVDFLVCFISKIMTLKPGDVITTGTPSGIGKMSKGDEVKVVLNDSIILTNYVEEENDN